VANESRYIFTIKIYIYIYIYLGIVIVTNYKHRLGTKRRNNLGTAMFLGILGVGGEGVVVFIRVDGEG